MSYYIGIDLGTSSVKTVLTDENGRVIADASEEYRLLQPRSGWKEISAQTWWEATLKTLKVVLERGLASQAQALGQTTQVQPPQAKTTQAQVLGQTPKTKTPFTIKGIGVTGQMHSLVLLDEKGEEIRPVLMWNDTRTADLVPELQKAVAETEEVSYINSILSTGSPAANMYWVRQNEPENFARIRHFLIGPDYIVYRLTGKFGTDFCEASTSSLYDLNKREWSEEMLEIVGISREICPDVHGSAEVAGYLLPEVADELEKYGLPKEIAENIKLSKDIKVLVGTGDNPAASIPTGCLGKGYPVLSLGTSAVFMFPRETANFEARGKNILFSFDGNNISTLVQGVVQSCGSGYSWLMGDIFETKDYGVADREITYERRGNGTLLCYPHLVGDKTLYKDPTLRGMYVGIGTDTGRVDFIQAYMEGIAYAVRQLVEALQLPEGLLTSLKVIGGGSKSRVWMQILADVLEIPIEQMEGNAGAGYGMALLAGYACGDIASVEEIADQAVTVKEVLLPEGEKIPAYRAGYEKYLRLHEAWKVIQGE